MSTISPNPTVTQAWGVFVADGDEFTLSLLESVIIEWRTTDTDTPIAGAIGGHALSPREREGLTRALSEPFLDNGQWRRPWVVTDRPIAEVREELALDQLGLSDEYETWSNNPARTFAEKAFIQHPETPMLARLAWQDALEFQRNSPTVLSLAGALNLTDADLDQLFIDAAGVTA